MKLYTKTGDTGETGLLGGQRVSKDHVRVDAYGQVDELNAAIGFALALEPRAFARDLLQGIQRDLLTVGAELAAPDLARAARALPERLIGAPEVAALEHAIDLQDASLPPLQSFVLPGGTPKGAALHVARTVCRRAERAVVTLRGRETISDTLVPYLNRLSDLLFALARAANAQGGEPDVTW